MNLLLLPGNSKRNKEWIYRINQRISADFDKSLVHDYAHWESGETLIDIDGELARVSQKARDLTPYIIFAKSAGSVLAIKGMREKHLNPRACVFVGLPLTFLDDLSLTVDEWTSEIQIPIVIIQNTNDPTGSFDDVNRYIQQLGNTNITLVQSEGDTHDYEDIDILREIVASLIA